MSTIQIKTTGMTSLETDALVNAANEKLWQGGGVCGVIFQAAGASQLQAACAPIGECKTGSAVITPGFNLKSKYIIHAVGPRWIDGKHNEPKLLYSAYKQSLILAAQNGCKSVGFPLLSAGIFGYPVDKAWRKALQSCLEFQDAHPEADIDIQFAVIDDKVLSIGKKILAELKKEKTTLYLKELDEESLRRIRHRISKESDLLIDKKAHPMAGALMNVICDPAVMDGLSANQLMKVIESIFPESVLGEEWISKYGLMLLRVVNESKKKKPSARAEKYEKYLSDVLIPALNAGSHSGTVMDDLERLEDIYKVAVCLYRFYHEKEAEFVFDADLQSMEELNKAIQDTSANGSNVLGIKLFTGGAEDRQYAAFMSWLLEEMLSKHEGLREGED